MSAQHAKPSFDHLGADTAGAVDINGCRDAGMTYRQVNRLLLTDRWQSPFPRVYVTFSGPIPATTLDHAALLYAGADATLSHESAGSYWYLCPRPARIHVTVPYGRHVVAQPGLVIHRSRSLCADDVHPALTPRRTRIERTVVDLLARASSASIALSITSDAMRNRRTTPDRLRLALAQAPRTRWRSQVLTALPDISAGAHSLLEIQDARMRRNHNLPDGERQFRRNGDGVEYLDIMIKKFRTHIEFDGRLGHDRAAEIWRDHRRDNRSELLNLRSLRYGWADMFDRECEVAAEQAAIFRQEGWTGTFTRCPRCPATV